MVRRAIFWSLVGQISTFGASLASLIVLSRILSPREIGIYAIGLAVSGFLQALSSFGIATFVVREPELTPETLDTAFTLNAGISLLLALVLGGSSLFAHVTGGEPMVGQVIRLLAIVPLLQAIEFRPATMLQREMGFGPIAVVTIARTLIAAAISIAAALLGASALSAAYGAIAGGVVGAVAFTLIGRRHASLRLSFAGWRRMAAFGVKTLLIGGIAVLVFRTTDILLGAILGFAALGYYNRAVTLASVTIQNVYASIARVFFVKLADDQRTGVPLRHNYLRGLEMTLAVMWPMLAGLAVLSGPTISLLFGVRWLPAATPLALLSIVQILGLSFAMNYELFVLRDQVGRQARYETIRALVGLAAFAYGCTWGLNGAAASRLIDPIIGMALYLPQLPRLSGATTRQFLRLFARNTGITMATILPPTIVMAAGGWPSQLSVSLFVVAVGGGAVLWLAALHALRHPLADEMRQYLDRLDAGRRKASRATE